MDELSQRRNMKKDKFLVLRALMIKHDLKIADLAKIIDMSISSTSRKLHNRQEWRLTEMLALTEYFNRSAEALFGEYCDLV